MPRGIKKVVEDIEVITPETEVIKDKGIYELKDRCECGKFLGDSYKVCPKCGKAR